MAEQHTCVFLILAVLCLVVLPIDCTNKKNDDGFTEGKYRNLVAAPVFMKVAAAENCPAEYKHGTVYDDENVTAGRLFEVGTSVNVTCSPYHPRWKHLYEIDDSQFQTYPSSTIKCQPDGTWFPQTICVIPHQLYAKKLNNAVEYTSFYDCTNKSHRHHKTKDCPQDMGSWTSVGNVNSTNSHQNSGPPNVATYSLFFGFPRKHYFWNIGITLPFKIHGVRVLVEKNAILSEDALRTSNIIPNISKKKEGKKMRSTTYWSTAVALDTDKVILNISVADHQPLNTSMKFISSHVRFYDILEGLPGNQAPLGYCPKPPTIPYATMLRTISLDEPNQHHVGSVVQFVCANGRVMYDSTTNSLSEGKLTCIDDNWFPYPFPTCRRTQLWPDNNNSNFVNDTKDPIQYTTINGGYYVLGTIMALLFIIVVIFALRYEHTKSFFKDLFKRLFGDRYESVGVPSRAV